MKLTISDDGPGMDEFTVARIFDPFFTTRRQEGGTGLGLTMVHGTVAQMKGTVRVISRPGQGSRFEIYLPCCPEVANNHVEKPKVSRAKLDGSETILFVDDESAIRDIAVEALTQLGYHVLPAEDGVRALEIFDAEQIDVVITDQTMPNMLGLQLAKKLRERSAEIPIILMSGADLPASDKIDYFMDKPFALEKLAQAVRGVLAETA
ncbi:MAG: response regulator [Gammaproteobacteria bacterium]|nr:response regulator [Gammaproteobacteria bacterium]